MKRAVLGLVAVLFAVSPGPLHAAGGNGAGGQSAGAGRQPSIVRNQAERLNNSTATMRRRDYLAANPGLDPQTAAAIERGECITGMTCEQVSASLGTPETRQEGDNNRERWRYSNGLKLEFENKKLVRQTQS